MYTHKLTHRPDTNTYHDTCQMHTNTRSVQHTGIRPAYKYWNVSWYVLVCIVQVFGMYYIMIPVNTSKYINTYQYLQDIPFSIHTNISEYVPINAIHTIHTNAYQYRSVLSNTYKYRQIQTNTYQYLKYI